MKELNNVRMGMIVLILIEIMLLMIAGNVSAEIEPDKLLPPVSKEVSQRQVIIGFEDSVDVVSMQEQKVKQELIKRCGGKGIGRNTK